MKDPQASATHPDAKEGNFSHFPPCFHPTRTMGAGASIATASNEHHHDHHDERRRFDSSRVSARSTTRGSVRAMALQNHARQENSYISADKLTLNIPSQIATEPKQRKFREASSKAIDEKIVEQVSHPMPLPLPPLACSLSAQSMCVCMCRLPT